MCSPSASVLQQWIEAHPRHAVRLRRQVPQALQELLLLQRPGATGADDVLPVDAWAAQLGRWVEREAPAPLLRLLAPRGAHPGATVVHAVAEILLVPREQRTEYVTHRLSSPPWHMPRLLTEYALWSLRVDRVLGALTKGFCAHRCERLPEGCCVVLGYDMGMVPEALLRAQRVEAELGGWRHRGHEPPCCYHGPRGCCLQRFKSPACAGMLCDALVAELQQRLPGGPLQAFLDPLGRFRNQVLDRAEIFALMRQVVEQGERLAAQGR